MSIINRCRRAVLGPEWSRVTQQLALD
jgi:hypothetical protein